jgi:hypothetical protein
MAQTEEEIRGIIKKSYAELNKMRKNKYKEYEGKCYTFNGVAYHIVSTQDKGFEILMIDDVGVAYVEMDLSVEQLKDNEITKEQFISILEKKVDLFIKQVKEN